MGGERYLAPSRHCLGAKKCLIALTNLKLCTGCPQFQARVVHNFAGSARKVILFRPKTVISFDIKAVVFLCICQHRVSM